MRNLTVLLIILLIVGCGTVETKTLKNEGNQKPKDDLKFLAELQINKWTSDYQKQNSLEIFFQDEEAEIKPFNSPDNKYAVYPNENKLNNYYEVWIKQAGNNLPDKLVYDYCGYGDVVLLWSPDSKHLSINERLGSSDRITTIVTFEQNGTELSVSKKHEQLSTKVEDEFYRLLWKDKAKEECDHFYMNVLAWSSDSSEVLVWVRGHCCAPEGKSYSGSFYIVYSLTNDKVMDVIKSFPPNKDDNYGD